MRTWSTERLLLRQLGPDAAPEVAAYLAACREFHAPWEPLHPADWWSVGAVRQRLATEVVEAEAQRQLVVYLSTSVQPARIIGRVALNNIIRGALQGCSVGYALAPAVTGQGLMTEALSRMVEVAFDELNLHRVEVNVVSHNAVSAAVAERCGFDREGTSPKFLHIGGVWEDHIRFVRVNDAWQAR